MNSNAFNAWHIVALGAGAFVVHAYHMIVNAGGLKRIWSNFWNGPVPADERPSAPPVPSTDAGPSQASTAPSIQKSP